MAVGRTCASCGADIEDGARYCRACGADVGQKVAEGRRVVTILFCDVVDSTPLAETLDPESLRRLLHRYFEEMRGVLEGHGGIVEKFIGDAIMAVFGVPQLHEDDAVRAMAAATEMRDGLKGLNAEFEATWGTRISARIGIETGEVIASDEERGELIVTGEAVNTAARLQQVADSDEIVVGERAYRLVRELVVAEPIGPIELKGRSAPVDAWRLLEVAGDRSPARRLGGSLVGRRAELSALMALLDRAGSDGCQLATIVGVAGIGKSRLTKEFIRQAESRATICHGRCLPYGDGITFWPIVQVVRDAAGITDAKSPEEAREKIRAVLPPGGAAAEVAERIAALIGLEGAAPGIQETFWAVRKFFEGLARDRPVVVYFDDIHWGEHTFLDLVEYLVDWIRDRPVLLLCSARPELSDVRPGWGAGKANATTLPLHALSSDETQRLIADIAGGGAMTPAVVERIATLAEGNPLFVEETLRMLADEGVLERGERGWSVIGDVSRIAIPPTIQALLSARLDRLDGEARGILERASVVGRVFSWGAVAELSPVDVRPRLAGHLGALMRKELIQPDYTESVREDRFRFTHILVRDAAYSGIPKSGRADLHARLATWVNASRPDGYGEFEEIIGYHFEQACRYLLELGQESDRVRSLAQAAADHLGTAGQRAFQRGDMPAADSLLTRATNLLPVGAPARSRLLPELAFSLMETGDFDRLLAVAAETSRSAESLDDPALKGNALILDLWIRLFTSPAGWAEEAEREARPAIDEFEMLGDDGLLAKGWSLVGLVHLLKAQFGAGEKAWERAADYARRAGEHRDELESLSWVPLMVWAGPTPVEAGLRRCDELIARAGEDKKATSSGLIAKAAFEASRGNVDEARALIQQARDLLAEVSLAVWVGGPLSQFAGWVELMAGDAIGAERELRAGYERLTQIGEMSWLSTVAGLLGEALLLQTRDAEAEAMAVACREAAPPDDAYSQAIWRSVVAKVRLRAGHGEEAAQLGGEAVEIAATTDFPHLQWYCLVTQARILRELGAGGAADSDRSAREVAARKGITVAWPGAVETDANSG